MDRLTNKLGNKAYLRCNCPDGDFFQKMINKLAEYEDLEDKGLINRNNLCLSGKKTEIDGKETLNILLNQIVALAQDNTDFDIKEVLPAYCSKKDLSEDYDGLFWGNEGATWSYRDNLDAVKLVDTYFVTFRKIHYPKLSHHNFGVYIGDDKWGRSEFPCRYDYLKSKEYSEEV